MININESLLIIGTGDTTYRQNYIHKVSTLREAAKYGEGSQLYNAYIDASEFGIADKIYMLNMVYDTDYPLIIDSLVQSDFTYIVPINIKFSDKITIDNATHKRMYYPEYFLSTIKDVNLSTIIMTDSHADNYEDIDHFVDSMENILRGFKRTSFSINSYGRNLCFVANNLVDYKYANLIVACMLLSCSLSEYPLQNCGEAVFDIDNHDVTSKEMSFFKYNIKRHATLENFHNFSTSNDQDKCMSISRCIKYVQRYLDLSEYCGKLHNGYLKVLIMNKLDSLLKDLVGTVISKYQILSCEFVQNKFTRTVVVLNTISITPVNTLEKYILTIEV